MADMMTFPDTWEEFEEFYGFTDKEEVYTNGSRLIESFRVKQWLDHIADEPLKVCIKPYKPTNREILDAIERADCDEETGHDCPWK